jgi:hypothetical protein
MKTTARIILLFAAILLPAMTASCNLPKRPVTRTPSPTITAQAQVSDTPSPSATATYIVGDLGWGPIHGKITDAVTGFPIVGAKVTCRHSSFTSPALCNASALTDEDGDYLFPDIFFHDTDRIQVEVQAQGYVTQSLAVGFITSPWIVADFALVPAIHSETPPAVCTPPACGPYDALYCPLGDCPGGCGMVCATPAAICTPPLCAIGTNEVYYCSEVCPGGCGTTCATITPGP